MAEITIDYTNVRNPQMRKFLEEEFKDVLFDVVAGHDHDGSNSKTLSAAAVVANDSVTEAKISAGAVTSTKIGDEAVTTGKLADDAVTAAKIADGTITVALMAANSIDSDQYVAGSIDTAHFAAGAVDTTALGADCVDGTKIADNAVDSEHIKAGAIDAAHFSAGAVNATALASNAVTTIKILDDNVTNAKLANMPRGTVKVGGASDAPTDLDANNSGYILVGDGTDVASVAVSGDVTLAANGAVTIAADAVTNTKLANIARGSVKVGGAENAPTDLNAKTDGYILVGDGTDIASVAVSGDVTLANTGEVTIANDAVSNAKLANIARGSIKVGGADDAPTDLVAKSDGYILVGDGTDVKSVAVSGDIALTNAGATAIGAGKVTTAMLAATTTPNAKAIVAAHEAAIPVTGNGDLPLTIADAAETNTLAVPTFAGQEICIYADTVAGSGSRTVTVASPINATGNNTILFDAVSEFIILRGIKAGATFAWRVVAVDGATLSTVG